MVTRIGIVAGALAATVTLSGAAQASSNPQAAPPSPDTLRQTTTAMLQPGDIPAQLGGAGAQNIGYYLPPGGQDPYPICQGDTRRAVLPDLTMATGYFSAIGPVTQTVYVYPSSDAAQSSWTKLRRAVERGCTSTRSVDGNLTKVSQGSAPAISGLWTVTSTTGKDPSGEYTQVALVDDAVIALRVNDYTSPTTTAERQAAASLMQTLVARYADRAVSTGVQNTALSIAEAAMLTPGDLPSSLPIQSPADGAWSSFSANLPGQAPFNQCNARKDLMPAGSGSFSATFGDDGGPVLTDGFAWQQVFTYTDSAAADAAWTSLTRSLQDCNQRYGKLYSATKPARVGKAGVSAITVDGTPGLFYRYFETQGSEDKDFRWSTRTYQVFLKDGNVISSLTYGISFDGIRRVSVDEPAVNQLAVTLIDRFVNTVVTTS